MQITAGITPLIDKDVLTVDTLFDKLGSCGMRIEIKLDEQVDPPEYRVVQVDAIGQEMLVFVQPVHHGFSIFDLMHVLDRIGFHVDYEEVK
jgi:hypothetical protein